MILPIPGLQRTVWLDLYHLLQSELCHAHPSSCCARRGVSTTSAINRGLRASREESRDQDRSGRSVGRIREGGRERKRQYDEPSERRGAFQTLRTDNIPKDGEVSRGEVAYARHVRARMGVAGVQAGQASLLRKGDGLGPNRATPTPVAKDTEALQSEAYATVRQIADLVFAIQAAESIPGASNSFVLISTARQKIADLNQQIPGRSLGERGSLKREVVFYLQRTLKASGSFMTLKAGDAVVEGERAEKTVVVENAAHRFALVGKGERVSEELFQAVKYGGVLSAKNTESDGGRRGHGMREGDAQPTESTDPLNPAEAAVHRERISRIRTLLDSISHNQHREGSATANDPATTEIHTLLRSLNLFQLTDAAFRQYARDYLAPGLGSEGSSGLFIRRSGGDGGGPLYHVKRRGKENEGFKLSFDAHRVWKGEGRDAADAKERELRSGKQEASAADTERADTERADFRRIRDLLRLLRDAWSKDPNSPQGRQQEHLVEVRSLVEKLELFSHGGGSKVRRGRVVLGRGNDFKFSVKREWGDSGHVRRVVFADLLGGGGFEVAFDAPGSSGAGTPPSPSVSDPQTAKEAKSAAREFTPTTTSDAPTFSRGSYTDDMAKRQVWRPLSSSTTTDPTTQPRQPSDDRSIPVSVPYTTAASEFLYGTNVILAALRAKRRKLYHLYLRARRPTDTNSPTHQNILSLAEDFGILIDHNAGLRLLDKMSDSRPHNGVVLEASRLPAPPVLSMGTPDQRLSILPLNLDRQSAEDIAVNGAPEALPTNTQTQRRPFVLMLDGIKDPENLGSILRTAHFFGVDAVAVAMATCCDLRSGVLAKASSGACEAVRLFALPRPSSFVVDSAKAGWKIYAAVAPSVPGVSPAADVKRQIGLAAVAAGTPLSKDPTILMLGAEGEGLRANLIRQADHLVSIEHGDRESETPDVGVDSLNVGVAAGVLLEAFLRKTGSGAAAGVGVARGGRTGDLGF